MVEWYRIGFSLERLMQEVAELVQAVLGRQIPVQVLDYRDAVLRHAQIDPLDATHAQLSAAARELGLDARSTAQASRDDLTICLISSSVRKSGRGSARTH
jgi:lysyl-tRNA synthetase class 2